MEVHQDEMRVPVFQFRSLRSNGYIRLTVQQSHLAGFGLWWLQTIQQRCTTPLPPLRLRGNLMIVKAPH